MKSIKGNKVILWDFNGTLLDDVDLSVDIANQLYQLCGVDAKMNRDDYLELFDFPVLKYYENAKFDLTNYSFEDLSKVYMNLYLEGFKELTVFPDIFEALVLAKNKGYCNIVLSASYQHYLKQQVESLGLADHFDEVCGISDIFAASKKEVALDLIQRHQFDEIVMIGDTQHDAEVAASLNASCYLIARGHFSAQRLINSGNSIYSNAMEVIECLE